MTKLDAANHFTVSHLENPDHWRVVERAQTIYSAGFFLTVSVESMLKVQGPEIKDKTDDSARTSFFTCIQVVP